MALHKVKELFRKEVVIDEDGYLVDFDDWNEAVARELAKRADVSDLTTVQIEALKFIRKFYSEYHFFPLIRAVCKNIHRPKDCMHEDFPNPLVAWKLAGLPHAEEPIISLLEAGQSPG